MIGQTLSVAATNDNLVLNVESADRYVFVFNVTDVNAPTLGVFKENYWGDTDVYIRGGMNGWGVEDMFSYQGEGVYTTDIELSAGSIEFKVASEDWATVNLGNPNDAVSNLVVEGVAKTLGSSNNNLTIEVIDGGLYEFKVSGPDGNAPTLTVTMK